MKTLVIYYSHGGTTRALAEKLAAEQAAEVYEVKLRKPLSKMGAFLMCPAAMRRKPTAKAVPIEADLAAYEKIIVMGPIWAGNFAPPVNNILLALPAQKQVEVCAVSGGSGGNRQAVEAQVAARGCTLAGYANLTRADLG